jgi:hypothetical protein
MFLTFYTEDSITYSISQGNDNDAINLIKKIYKSDQDYDGILSNLKKLSQKDASGVSLGQACCDSK